MTSGNNDSSPWSKILTLKDGYEILLVFVSCVLFLFPSFNYASILSSLYPDWYVELVSQGFEAHGYSFFFVIPGATMYPLIVLLIIIWLQSRYRRNLGVTCGRPRVRFFFRVTNPLQWWRLIKKIHDFQHAIEKCLRNISDCKAMNDRKMIENVSILLEHIQQAVRIITGADASVHLKIFSSENGTLSNPVSHEEAILSTYCRVPAIHEERSSNSDTSKQRKDEETFKILPYPEGKASSLFDTENTNYFPESGGHKVNSAYNYCFSEGQHHWVNNDLLTLQEQKKFYSTSNRWDEFYRSLIVLTINEHDPEKKPYFERRDTCPLGLLLIDSTAKGAFDRHITPRIFGYFAHRLWHYMYDAEAICESRC